MIVVSDTSPINYLILIELQDLLPKLFDRILIPEAVHRKLQSAAAPDPIKPVLAEAPDWLEVRSSPEIDPALQQLDSGEREVITLALSIKAESVLLDERRGRQAARERGLRVSGRRYHRLKRRWPGCPCGSLTRVQRLQGDGVLPCMGGRWNLATKIARIHWSSRDDTRRQPRRETDTRPVRIR